MREHFSTEEALLSIAVYPALDEHREALDEFEELVANVITTDNFDMSEIQRFLVLWWIGHMIDSFKKRRAFVEK